MTDLSLSYRSSKQMRKSLYDDISSQVPPDGEEAKRWNELSQEFGVPRSMTLGQATAILMVIAKEQQEELDEEGVAVVVVDDDARKDN